MNERQVSRSVVVDARPEDVFALLADPRMHAVIDGSGSVKGAVSGPAKLSPGARFGMRMRIGLPYVVRNQVVEYDEGRLIGWQHFHHHVWRFELEPVGEGTKVTETFDWAPSRSPRYIERFGHPARNATNMEKTLARLRQHFA